MSVNGGRLENYRTLFPPWTTYVFLPDPVGTSWIAVFIATSYRAWEGSVVGADNR